MYKKEDLIKSIIIVFEITTILILLWLFHSMDRYDKELYLSSEQQIKMLKAADKLRQSSDDLTQFARTYVVTGNERFKRRYFKTLDIRNGKARRPKGYDGIYWDLTRNVRLKKHPDGDYLSLNKIFDSLPFTKAELAKLRESKQNSDDLTKMEIKAFNAMKGLYQDANGNYTIKKEPNQALAIKIMHSDAYYRAKYKIMNPIDDFMTMLNNRTNKNIDAIKHKIDINLIAIVIVSLLFIIANIFIFIYLRRVENEKLKKYNRLNQELEKSKDELHIVNKSLEEKIEEEKQKNKEKNAIFKDIEERLSKFASGDLSVRIDKNYGNVYLILQEAINNLFAQLEENDIKNKKQNWIKNGISKLNKVVSGNNSIDEVNAKAINYVCNYLNAGIGAIYSYDKKNAILVQSGGFAYVPREDIPNKFALGEGIVGQVALQKTPILLQNIKRTQMLINTGTTSEAPLNTYTFPLIYQNKLFGVIEIGSNEIFDNYASEFLNQSNQIIATALSSAIANNRVKVLLNEAQTKNEEIQEANAQMEEQQQQLEEANAQMEEQQQQLKEKNKILEISQKELNKKANDLEQSGKYKSEFLANMSHELRTPLNSIILLSDMLRENKTTHLTDEEVKKASIIHNSGEELLRLVNDILDLSKINAGKMDIIIEQFNSSDLCEDFKTQFEYQAKEKNLDFIIKDDYQGIIKTDKNKLGQILRNFISNSLKFTKEGNITLSVSKAEDEKIKISLSDTGIGIAKNKLESIFEAFQQEDGSTSREYGGTGLGLSISKKLVKILGGEVFLKSTQGVGSTFSIVIPNLEIQEKKQIKDDRDIITVVDRPFLIIEDNENFALILKEKINKTKDYALIALNGKDGLELAKQYDIKGVMLDLELPDMNGIDLLSEFKTNTDLRNIPVYVISGADKDMPTKLNDAIGFAHKPISEDKINEVINSINQFNKKDENLKDLNIKGKKVLIADDDIRNIYVLSELLISKGAEVITANNGKEAIEIVDKNLDIDIVLMDIMMPVMDGYEATQIIRKNPKTKDIPIIAVTAKSMEQDKQKALEVGCNDYVSKPIRTDTLIAMMKAWLLKNNDI